MIIMRTMLTTFRIAHRLVVRKAQRAHDRVIDVELRRIAKQPFREVVRVADRDIRLPRTDGATGRNID
jgi:hypothetical protein